MRFLLLLVLWPLTEIALFVTIGGRIGLLATMAILLASFALGAWLIRQQGRDAMKQARLGLQSRDLGRGLFHVIAGVLLILPGFLTDILGLLLLLPPVQAGLARLILSRVQIRPQPSSVIDGEWSRLDDQAQPYDISKD